MKIKDKMRGHVARMGEMRMKIKDKMGGHVARMGEMRNAYKLLVEKETGGTYHL
jgi:hypothetical protein